MRSERSLFDVVFGAAHIGLDHGSHIIGVARNAVEFVNEVEGALRVGRAFHIDANEIRGRHAGGFGDQAADDVIGHLLVDVEAHVSELQADVGVQFVGGDFVEKMVVELGAVAGFFSVGDVLAQIVDGDAGAELIDGGGGADGVGNLLAGDKTGRDPLAEAGTFGDAAQSPAF